MHFGKACKSVLEYGVKAGFIFWFGNPIKIGLPNQKQSKQALPLDKPAQANKPVKFTRHEPVKRQNTQRRHAKPTGGIGHHFDGRTDSCFRHHHRHVRTASA